MEKSQKVILEQRYHMSKKLLDKGISENIILNIAHLFKPITKKETGEKGQEIAERLAKRITEILEAKTPEDKIIQEATKYQRELLKEL